MGATAAAYARKINLSSTKKTAATTATFTMTLLRRQTHPPLSDSAPILIAPAETPPQTFLSLQGTPIFLSMGGGEQQQHATA